MTTPPLIFDRALWRKRLARAARAKEPCDFLAARVAEDLAFRLAPIRRDFPRALDLGSPHPAISQALAAPGRLVFRAAPVFGIAASAPALVADEEALPFAPESFDLVVSALSLQFANDLPGVFAQVRRILAPDSCAGSGTALVWGAQMNGDVFDANGCTAIAVNVDPGTATGASAGVCGAVTVTVTLQTNSTDRRRIYLRHSEQHRNSCQCDGDEDDGAGGQRQHGRGDNLRQS